MARSSVYQQDERRRSPAPCERCRATNSRERAYVRANARKRQRLGTALSIPTRASIQRCIRLAKLHFICTIIISWVPPMRPLTADAFFSSSPPPLIPLRSCPPAEQKSDAFHLYAPRIISRSFHCDIIVKYVSFFLFPFLFLC